MEQHEVAEMLSSADADARVYALRFLKSLGEGCAEFEGQIRFCLTDDDPMVRQEAVEALRAPARAGGVRLPPLAELLACADGRARCAAAVALGAAGERASDYIAALAGLLRDEFEDLGSGVLSAACLMGRLPATLRVCRCAGAWALGEAGAAEPALVAGRLVGLLDDRNAEVRRAAAEALGRLGPPAAAHEEQVLRLLADADARVRAAAARAVGSFGEARGASGAAAAEAVAALLRSQHPCSREAAAAALGRMGEAAHGHLGELLKCLGDRCSKVRVAAIGSLARSGPRGQMYAADIARVIQGEDSSAAVAAIEALAGMGQRGAAFADEVADALEDPRDSVRAAAAAALEGLGWGGQAPDLSRGTS